MSKAIPFSVMLSLGASLCVIGPGCGGAPVGSAGNGAGQGLSGAAQALPEGAGALPYLAAHKPPPDAVILFNGKDLSKWRRTDGQPAAWKVDGGAITAGGGDIVTQDTFADAFLHLEFRVPHMPEATGQARGNSGVYLHGRYEVQVLDSYGIKVPGKGDCGAIYGQHAPLVNACKPPLEWQSYDIIFRAPRLDESGRVVEWARMTVLQNGRVIQNNAEVVGTTAAALDDKVVATGPLMLQDHGNPVQYRNIWLVPLPLKGSEAY